MEKEVMDQAMAEFKKEQAVRQVEKVKESFKEVVNHFCRISEIEERIAEEFEDLGFEVTPEFREFLKSVEKYEDLVISVTAHGNVGIGTTAPDSEVFVVNLESKRIEKV